jgi:hypothetical protein
MTEARPMEFQERKVELPPFTVRVRSYLLDGDFYSAVDNIDPGAVLARARGATREEAELEALRVAGRRLEFSATRAKRSLQPDVER